MAPYRGAIHRRPRSDSGAVRIWEWARSRRGSWTISEAVETTDVSRRRCQAIVTAMHGAGLVDQVRESELSSDGQTPAEWRLSPAGRAMQAGPIMIVDPDTGLITGCRPAPSGDGNAKLRRAVELAGMSGRGAARVLGISDRTLRQILAGQIQIAENDPLLARLSTLIEQ